MQTVCPEYIPPPVWTFYCELTKPGPGGSLPLIERPPYKAPVRRLLGLDPESPANIAKTWRNLARAINGANRPAWAESDWRLLFDSLWTLPRSFDSGAYQGLRRARDLAPRIGELARELADALAEYRELAARHLIAIPDQGLSTVDWIEQAGLTGPDPGRFEAYCLPFFGFSVPGRLDVQYLPPPDSMLHNLAVAFGDCAPATEAAFSDHANASEVSRQTAIVNHFEDRWGWYQGRGRPDKQPPAVMAAHFEIGPSDLARILTALFGFEFSREAVNYARRERAKKR